jgi:DNA-binding protein HU-beta
MKSTTKAAFVAELAATNQMTQQQARVAVDAVVTTLAQTLIAGQNITLPGLGTFSLKERAARMGRNPATGESVQIPAKRSVHFKAASDLQRQIPQPE